MTGEYEVVSSGRWPSGDEKPAAVVRYDVSELEKRLGASFLHGEDDLGAFRQLGLRLTSGRLVLFSRHDEEPNRGASLYIDGEDSVRDAVSEVARALALDEEDFVWISPADQTP